MAQHSNLPVVIDGAHSGVSESAIGGALEGAERTDLQTLLWNPSMGSPDQLINRSKDLGDARGRDMQFNDGMAHGAIAIHKDSVVGSQYRLNAQPVIAILKSISKGFDDTWQEEMQDVVEARFTLTAESDANWFDAARVNNFTNMVRLVVGGFVTTGEVVSTGEWFGKDRQRPCKTAVQLVAGSRLSNPNGLSDTRTLKRGVQKDRRGRPLGYWFRKSHPAEQYDIDGYTWDFVPAQTRWGRQQVLHIVEQMQIDQTRGVADMVSALKDMRMAKTYKETALQNAVINASYAAALESDLPPDVVYGVMGQGNGPENFQAAMGVYLSILQSFFGAANIAIDGAKVPVLPPGTKFNARALGTPGGLGTDFEISQHRHICAALGISYEEFSRNYSNVSYSAARASGQNTNRFMRARKKVVADRFANFIYGLWFEEEINAGNVPLPRGVSPEVFYVPLMKEALLQASWIGAGAGQIDELKETQAAIMRIKGGLSSYEVEIARFGRDWRPMFKQIAREQGIIKKLGLGFEMDVQKAGAKQSQNQQASDVASPDGNKKK